MVDDFESGEAKTVPPIQELTEPAPKPIASGLAFSGLANIRNTEAQLRWVGFQAAIGLNFLGWGGVAAWALADPSKPELAVLMSACLGAIYSNLLHFKIIGRDGKFMGLWNDKLIELERVNGIEGNVKIVSSNRYIELKERKPTIQWILRRSVILCTLVWAAFALISCASILI